jgi:hypothetical protein
MDLITQRMRALTRRHFLAGGPLSLGAMALGGMLGGPARAAASPASVNPLTPRPPQFTARAKHIIYLHMSGGPPHHDMFDYKPKLVELDARPVPTEWFEGQRIPFSRPGAVLLGTPHKFHQHGQAGVWVSELLKGFPRIVDDATVIRSMVTDQFNHAPAELLIYTGSPRAGAASMGSWLTYGLGSENENLPGFVVLLSGGTDPTGGKALWSSGFLPSVYQGVQCRSAGEPILYVNNPAGIGRDTRRRTLDALRQLNEYELQQFGDPETLTRIEQYELAYRMQLAVPEVMDIAKEPQHVREMYGAEPGKASFANNCLLARRLVEQGVRYVQLFDWGWDFHGVSAGTDIVKDLPAKCAEMDKPVTALVEDLKARGMLEDTLVIWGGEFGRTSFRENRGGVYTQFVGRDHHPHSFTIWMAGGGVKAGHLIGETDDLGYFVTRDKVTVHDLQATILHLMGIHPDRFTYPYQGLNQRLIGPADGPEVVRELLA